MTELGGKHSRVLVIDFGGQYAHLIARRVREVERWSEIAYPGEDLASLIRDSDAIILSGGPSSVWEANHDSIASMAIDSGKHVLGICYGHQLLAKVLGGRVGRSPRPEFGSTRVRILRGGGLLEGFPPEVDVWMSHNDAVLEPPPGARVLATSPGSPVAAFSYGDRVYGVQWHPEVSHSWGGLLLLDNFLKLAGLPRDWRPEDLIESLTGYVRGLVGDGIAVAAVSGGVDSTVAALIARRALGDRLVPVFIDHGLHPEGEVEWVVEKLSGLGLEPRVVDASTLFLDGLRGVVDPEEKRRVVGRIYGEVLRREAERVGAGFLVQGTIYPDVIESGARPGADTIKTHHNVGGLPRRLGLVLVEPLKWFYKDEVRRIGRMLGLGDDMVEKKPIPGPGLAVRIEGEVTPEKIRIARAADRIVREEIEGAGLHRGLWQYFAVLTSSRATGVKGDRRAYGHVVAVRVVESVDAMTASPSRLPWIVLERIASRITGEIPEVTRVVYDITSKPPATIEWE